MFLKMTELKATELPQLPYLCTAHLWSQLSLCGSCSNFVTNFLAYATTVSSSSLLCS